MTDDMQREHEDARAKRQGMIPQEGYQCDEMRAGTEIGKSMASPPNPALIAEGKLEGRGNSPIRAVALHSTQATYGNRAVQRFVQQAISSPLYPVQRAPQSTPALSQEDMEKTVGNITGTMDFGKQASEMWLGDDLPGGFGIGMDMAGEMMNRGGSGQGFWESLGGGLTKALTTGFTGSDMFKSAVGESGKGVSVTGLVGSGMKMLGSMMGEKDEDIGVGDAGDYVSTAGTLSSGPALAAQGIQEGMMGLYNTAQSAADWATGGGTGKFLKQGEDQLKGKSGSITQGYSMLANLVGSAATGDYSEMHRIGSMADKGELGALPQLGSKLGDWTYNVSEVAGAGFGMVGDLLSGDTANIRNRQELMAVNNPLGKAVNNAGEWLGDKAFDMLGPAPAWMQDLF
jgi:hypothetical protein